MEYRLSLFNSDSRGSTTSPHEPTAGVTTMTYTSNITLDLGDGILIELGFTNARYDGIVGASRDGSPFLVRGRGSLPWCRTPDGIVYDEFHLADHSQTENEHVISFLAIGRPAPIASDTDMFGFPLMTKNSIRDRIEDRLELRLSPAKEIVGGEEWRGFTIQYTWRSSSRQIHWLYESVAMAPNGKSSGARVIAQNMTQNFCPLDVELLEDTAWSTHEHYHRSCIESPCRGAGSQIFDLIQGDGMSVATWFPNPPLNDNAIRGNFQHCPGDEYVTSSDLHFAGLSNSFTTSPRSVLAAPRSSTTREDAVNRWTAWHEASAERWCTAIGLIRSRSEPMLTFEGTGAGGIDAGVTYPELLATWIDRLDWVAAQGFKIINLHTPEWVGAANRKTAIYQGNNCCPFEFTLSDHLGGEAGLKAFCDACHLRGIKVMIWICGHLHRESPAWRQHPEWQARTGDGRIWDGHYGIIQSIDLAQPAARKWIADDLVRLRRATGVDAVWCDSFAGLFMGVVNHASEQRIPAATGTLLLFRELAAAGYSIAIEGMSQLGLSSWGNLPPSTLAGRQELLINTSFRYFMKDWGQDPAINQESYFRSLAARAPFGVWMAEFFGHAESFPPALPNWYAPLTTAFNQISNRMHRRILLDTGAMWYDQDGHPSCYFAITPGGHHQDLIRPGWKTLYGGGITMAGSISTFTD